jgi:hypothetical protein
MSKQQTEMLVQRLDRLERETRLLKRTGVAALAAIAAVMLMGQALPSKVAKLVEAEKFLVRDAAGKPRATLGLLPDGSPSLNLIDGHLAGRLACPRLIRQGRRDTSLAWQQLPYEDAPGGNRDPTCVFARFV